jgi:Flp pilus assembly protein TadD
MQLLRLYPGQAANEVFRDALSHSDPLIRRAALEGLETLPPPQRSALAVPLLGDPVRAVRIEAALLLASLAPGQLDQAARPAFDAALAEYVAAQHENADRPEAHLNLGGLYASLRKPDQAEAEYRKAIELNSAFVPGYANLADLQRATGLEHQAELTLREGLRAAPASAPLHHALGLSLIRQKRSPQALAELALAAKQAPEDPHYAYVYGIALHDLGKSRESMSVLESALARYPGDRDLLAALAGYARDSGDAQAAARYSKQLRQLERDTH